MLSLTYVYYASARLSPRAIQSHANHSSHRSRPLTAYGNLTEFAAALDHWCNKWSSLHNGKNESNEATVLRLSAKLNNDAGILRVTDS